MKEYVNEPSQDQKTSPIQGNVDITSVVEDTLELDFLFWSKRHPSQEEVTQFMKQPVFSSFLLLFNKELHCGSGPTFKVTLDFTQQAFK